MLQFRACAARHAKGESRRPMIDGLSPMSWRPAANLYAGGKRARRPPKITAFFSHFQLWRRANYDSGAQPRTCYKRRARSQPNHRLAPANNRRCALTKSSHVKRALFVSSRSFSLTLAPMKSRHDFGSSDGLIGANRGRPTEATSSELARACCSCCCGCQRCVFFKGQL